MNSIAGYFQILQYHFSYSPWIFLKQINVCVSSIYNDTNKPNFKKLEKIIELLSWSKHSLSNSEKKRMYPCLF